MFLIGMVMTIMALRLRLLGWGLACRDANGGYPHARSRQFPQDAERAVLLGVRAGQLSNEPDCVLHRHRQSSRADGGPGAARPRDRHVVSVILVGSGGGDAGDAGDAGGDGQT
jgi:hypothetical protein